MRGLTVVLADGTVIRTGGRARRSSAGYDLARLFVGSEGTLGVIAEVTVRLLGLPRRRGRRPSRLRLDGGAVETVIATIQLGIPVARVELLDEVVIDAVNRYSNLSDAVKPTLLFEFHGTSPASVTESVTAVQEMTGGAWRIRFPVGHHAGGSHPPVAGPAQHALRRARARPGGKPWVTDVCVPISRLAECIVDTARPG